MSFPTWAPAVKGLRLSPRVVLFAAIPTEPARSCVPQVEARREGGLIPCPYNPARPRHSLGATCGGRASASLAPACAGAGGGMTTDQAEASPGPESIPKIADSAHPGGVSERYAAIGDRTERLGVALAARGDGVVTSGSETAWFCSDAEVRKVLHEIVGTRHQDDAC